MSDRVERFLHAFRASCKRLDFNDLSRQGRREYYDKLQKVEGKLYAKTMKRVQELVTSELEHTRKDHPPFASLHEAYAVTLEEVSEAQMDMSDVIDTLDIMWSEIRADNAENAMEDAEELWRAACRLACEAIQVAAMAKKTMEVGEGAD